LLYGQESESLEFKRSTGELEDALEDIVAMLNKSGGGELYFGIRNDGEVIGQQVGATTLRTVSLAISNHIAPVIFPTVEKVIVDNKSCIKVTFDGTDTPYYCRGRAYIRVSEESKLMSPAKVKQFIKTQLATLSPWDSEVSDLTLDDIDDKQLKAFVDKAIEEKRIDWQYAGIEDALSKLELIADGKPLNAAKVLFSTRSGLEIQMATFATTERLTFLDISNAMGTIKELVDAGEMYIKKIMLWRAEFGDGMERHEVPEVPVEAIREALWNSYAHRLGDSNQNNEIAIYKDRIEIYNPGTFPEEVEPEDYITKTTRPIQRNKLLARTMYYPRYIERFGTGIKRINDACVEAGVAYEFRREALGFTVVFYRPKDLVLDPVTGKPKAKFPDRFSDRFSDRFPENFSERERHLLELIAADGKQTSEAMADSLGVSRRTITKRLGLLKESGLIIRIGSDKKGYWQIVNPDTEA